MLAENRRDAMVQAADRGGRRPGGDTGVARQGVDG
jgi:hypothetical protein